MNDHHPINGHDEEWSDAEWRVRAYLLALGVTRRGQQDRVVATILERARAELADHPGESPVALAMKEIRVLSEEWFARLLPGRERPAAAGLVQLDAVNAAPNWPDVLLAGELPADIRRALSGWEVSAAPDLKVSRMVPQPFESPLSDLNLPTALEELTKNLSPSLVSRALALVLSGLALLVGNRMR